MSGENSPKSPHRTNNKPVHIANGNNNNKTRLQLHYHGGTDKLQIDIPVPTKDTYDEIHALLCAQLAVTTDCVFVLQQPIGRDVHADPTTEYQHYTLLAATAGEYDLLLQVNVAICPTLTDVISSGKGLDVICSLNGVLTLIGQTLTLRLTVETSTGRKGIQEKVQVAAQSTCALTKVVPTNEVVTRNLTVKDSIGGNLSAGYPLAITAGATLSHEVDEEKHISEWATVGRSIQIDAVRGYQWDMWCVPGLKYWPATARGSLVTVYELSWNITDILPRPRPPPPPAVIVGVNPCSFQPVFRSFDVTIEVTTHTRVYTNEKYIQNRRTVTPCNHGIGDHHTFRFALHIRLQEYTAFKLFNVDFDRTALGFVVPA